MIQSTDVEGRLRLFRYGLIVIVVVTFLVSLLAPYAITAPWAAEFNQLATATGQEPQVVTVTTFLTQALITTIIVAIIMAVVYFIYRQWLLGRTRRA